MEELPTEVGYVIWLRAPAGFGKSVLAGQLAGWLGWPTYWASSLLGNPKDQLSKTLGLPMKNLRRENKGQALLLSPELQTAFYQALLQPHPRDGLWNIRNAAEWLSQRLGRPVDPRRAWSWMCMPS
jgi:hypothetical protein